jgi:hypothetical protein
MHYVYCLIDPAGTIQEVHEWNNQPWADEQNRYEAVPGRVSVHMNAKLSRPRLRRRRSGGCTGTAGDSSSSYLGDLARL